MQISRREKFFSCLLFLGFMLWSATATAQTQGALQGDVAVRLSGLLGLEPAPPAQTIATLSSLGIIPQGGWSPKASVSQEFIASLLDSLARALRTGAVSLPIGLPDASAVLAAALTSAGGSSSGTVQGLIMAGGGGTQAFLGAGRGTGLSAGPALSSGGGGGLGGILPNECPGFRQRPGGAGGGGSGCVATPSR